MRFIELYESSSYLLLETPQRLAWLIANRGAKLLAKYEEEKTHGVILPDTQRHVDLIDGESPEEKLVKFIMSFDPTPAKNYSNWLCSRYMARPDKGGCRLEDLNATVTGNLAVFERVSRSRRIQNGNLDSYKTLQDLEDVVAPFRDGDREVSNRADRAAGRSTAEALMFPASDPMRTDHHVVDLLDTPECLILQLKTEEAARYFGENTNWCTTAGMFNNYNERSPLYIICDRKKNTRVQFHFNGGSSQFMDERDKAINLNAYLKEHPAVFKVFHKQFLALLGVSTYGGHTVDIKFFTDEELKEAPIKTLSRMVKRASDLDRFKTLISEEGFNAIILRRPSSEHSRWNSNGEPFEREVFARILNKMFKPLGATFVIGRMMENNTWMWDYLPEKWKTEKVTNNLAMLFAETTNGGSLPMRITTYFGDDQSAWTDKIKSIYYDAGAEQGWSTERFPENELTDKRLAISLGTNGDEIPNFVDRLTPKLVAEIIKNTASGDVAEVFEHLPKEYLTKEAAKALHQQANQFKAKRDQYQRDQFLRALTYFDHGHWGSKAERVAELYKGDFAKLPPQFHTKEFAAKMVSEQPGALARIPAAFIDQNVVNRAMEDGDWSRIFNEVNPKIITPEMVLEGVKASNSRKMTLALDLPEVFKTYRPMLDYLLERGGLPLDDEHWPSDAWKPQYVVKAININCHGNRPVSAPSSSSYGYNSYSSRSRDQERMVENSKDRWDAAFEKSWEAIPELGKTSEIISAIVKQFPMAARLIGEQDQKYLTNSVMIAWMEAVERSSERKEIKTNFEAFPKSAWSNSILAEAIKRGYIQEIPEEFKDKQDPQTIIQMIVSRDHYKSVDWSKVTSDMLISAIDSSAYESIIKRVPSDSPLLDDEEVVYAALRHETKDGRSAFSYSHSKNYIQTIWPPERRSHWTQRDWDLAGGGLIPLEEIPTKFVNDDLTVDSVLRDPSNLSTVKNPIKWLNDNSDRFTTNKHFKINSWIKEGIYYDGHQWIDDKKSKHTEAKGGSYSVVKTSTGATIAYIYDTKGNLVDGLASKLKSGESYSQTTSHLVSAWGDNSYMGTEKKMKNLAPFRDVIEDIIDNHPEIEESLRGQWSNHLSPLDFYISKTNNQDRLVKLEKLPRSKISEDSDLTYTIPNAGYTSNTRFVLYNGGEENSEHVGDIFIDRSHRGGNKFISSRILGNGADHIRLSKTLATFMYDIADVPSGSGPKFKESDIYRSCGVRGTGSFEWFSLFDEKIMEHGGMSIWRQGKTVSIADDEHGLVATGKKAKDGSFTMTERFTQDVEETKLAKMFTLMNGKL